MSKLSDRYLSAFVQDKLTSDEAAEIALRISEDSELSERVTEIRRVLLAGKLQQMDEIRLALGQLPSPSPPAVSVRPWWRSWWIGALCVVILLALAFALRPRKPEPQSPLIDQVPGDTKLTTPPNIPLRIDSVPASRQQVSEDTFIYAEQPDDPIKESNPTIIEDSPQDRLLAMSFYKPPVSLGSSLREDADQSTDTLAIVASALKERRGNDALKLLNQIESHSSLRVIAREYFAHAYFLTEDFEKATETFESVLADRSGAGRDPIEWYLVLSMLGASENDVTPKINELMRKITNPENFHTYRESGVHLRQALNL